MSGLKLCLAATALLGGFGASVYAQGVVPGGWATQFGYQTFGGSGFVGGSSFGYGMPGVGFGVSPYGGSGFNAYGPGVSPYGQGFAPFGPNAGQATYPSALYNATMPQAVNGVDPLIHVIRQSTRPSRRR